MTEKQTVDVKQRIIGAIVLVSLGVIFIPLLLNGGVIPKQIISQSNIPQMPKELSKPLPEIPRPEVFPEPKTIASRPVGEFTRQPKNEQKEKQSELIKPLAHKKPVAKKNIVKKEQISKYQYEKASKPVSSKITMAYTLQIASFVKKKNALALRNKLRKKHFKSYIESIMISKSKIYRLRVGPYLKYQQILNAQKKIEKQFKLSKTLIVKYKT